MSDFHSSLESETITGLNHIKFCFRLGISPIFKINVLKSSFNETFFFYFRIEQMYKLSKLKHE